jgi:hypothetical protein
MSEEELEESFINQTMGHYDIENIQRIKVLYSSTSPSKYPTETSKAFAITTTS